LPELGVKALLNERGEKRKEKLAIFLDSERDSDSVQKVRMQK
jgi:hypothetical protein